MSTRTLTFVIFVTWLLAVVGIIVATMNIARAADMADCKTYATRGSAAALKALLPFPFIDVASGKFLFRKAYSFCLNADELPEMTFTEEEQPIVDGRITPLPPMKPEGAVPATGPEDEQQAQVSGNLPPEPANPPESAGSAAPKGKALCIKHGKRTVYHGKNGKKWRCVK